MLLLAGYVGIEEGIQQGGDSERYIDGAVRLRQGAPLNPQQSRCFGYVALLCLADLSFGPGGLVAFQLCVLAGAVGAQYRLTSMLASPRASCLAGAFFVAYPELARWHAFLLPESLYTSVLTLSTWCVARALSAPPGATVVAFLLLLATASLRPQGLVLAAAAAPLLVMRHVAGARSRVIVGGLVLLIATALVLLTPAFRAYLGSGRPLAYLTSGTVIWGYPGEPGEASVGRAVWLAVQRVCVALAHVRTHNSVRHNAFVAATLLPLYCLALLGLWRRRTHPVVQVIVGVIVVHLFVVALSHADWDGRWLTQLLPLIAVLAAIGFDVVSRTAESMPKT